MSFVTIVIALAYRLLESGFVINGSFFDSYWYIYYCTMNLNNFTIKSQEAIQHAFEVAAGNGQQAVETGHILKGLLSSGESVMNFLFGKTGANAIQIDKVLNRIIESYPRVTGGEAVSFR